jgi:hypothetical protein
VYRFSGDSSLRCLCVGLIAALAGCRQSAAPPPPAAAPAPPPAAARAPAPAKPIQKAPRSSPFWEAAAAEMKDRPEDPLRAPAASDVPFPKPQIDDRKAAEAGIRKLAGKRLVLYTDLASRPEIDNLCGLADQAYPQWCRYFQVDPETEPDWQMTGYLIGDKRKFQAASLFPETLPDFGYGYCRDQEFWLYDQQTDYYRRHLLLHEMTHGFMYTRLRASAPPWYIEGIAELLATHRLVDGRLEMNYFPQHKEETPDWGRIKLVQDGFAEGKALFFSQVLTLPLEAHLRVENYGWCWAAAALLDGHPRYRERFRQMARDVAEPDFAGRFRQTFADDWLDLDEEWQLFIGWMEYGYDRQRSAVEFRPGKELRPDGVTVKIAADRGWQSSGLRLVAGKPYRLRARGRYEVAQEPQPWISEPNGVSIRYYKQAPLGILAAAVRPEVREEGDISTFFRAEFVGLDLVIRPAATGTLYLRINDSNAELADNRGELEVEVQPVN